MKQKVIYEWLKGKSYKDIWEYQSGLHQALILSKRIKQNSEEVSEATIHHLLFCEHNPVITMGKSGKDEHLLLDENDLKSRDIEYYKINRGGDITYHGPGQLTGYPIFDLELFYTDVHRYVRELEEVIILSIAEWGIQGFRLPKYTGVWVGDGPERNNARKICAIGVHLSRWVTLHGFALNVNTDLTYFNHIIPCGIKEDELTVTSIEKETGQKIDIRLVEEVLKSNFAQIFGLEYL
ncbi:MAG: lipoyl(octanoyl) transferase LipB [Saprospiraceae bacterium]|nr:lipoyl(octanoyl) transferase LipB [Saprospiraceae bacterium]